VLLAQNTKQDKLLEKICFVRKSFMQSFFQFTGYNYLFKSTLLALLVKCHGALHYRLDSGNPRTNALRVNSVKCIRIEFGRERRKDGRKEGRNEGPMGEMQTWT
jgi:hypothetical protein